jgi:ribose-phosphate pyrophosphokinase
MFRYYVGDIVKDRDIIVVDDMMHSGTKLTNTVKHVRQNGAGNIHAFITHNLLTPQTFNEIDKLPIKELITTNSISNVSL